MQTYHFPNGDVYEGEVMDGKCHGRGKYTWADGESYDGDWVEGKRTGKGIYRFASGNVYEGEFLENVLNGEGVYRYANGEIRRGRWFMGSYVEVKPADPVWGKKQYTNGTYEGQLVNDKPQGRGTLRFADGNVFTGTWMAGEPRGQGKLIGADGSVYKGEFSGFRRHGRGSYTWANGDVFEGEFAEDKRHGRGIYRYADGAVKRGRWEKGTYVEGSGSYKSALDAQWEDYRELYDWRDMGLGNTAAYNAHFQRLRSLGKAQEVVRSIVGGSDLSRVHPGDAFVCLFILERFVPRGADRELLARCLYLTGEYSKAAGVLALSVEGSHIHRHRPWKVPSNGLAMEIMAAHYWNRSGKCNSAMIIDGCLYQWPYVALRRVEKARIYLEQANYCSAHYARVRLKQEIDKRWEELKALVLTGKYHEML